MATSKRKTISPEQTSWYRGKQAKTGNSLGLRFDKALFQSHPEFNGAVRARIIGPGRMLVVAQPSTGGAPGEDPVIASFLSFLAQDMIARPHRIAPLDRKLAARMNRLVSNVRTNPDEDLGDEPAL